VIFIEVEGGEAPRFWLEFHPRLTVVTGLDEVQRRELCQSLHDALAGRGRRTKLTVDLGGQPQPLTYDHVLELGLDSLPFDNVVSRSSFVEQSHSAGSSGTFPMIRSSAVVEAEKALQSALLEVRKLEMQLSTLPSEPTRVDPAELAAAESLCAQLSQRLSQLAGNGEGNAGAGEPHLDNDLGQLEGLKSSIEAKLAQVRRELEDQPGSLARITAALATAINGPELMREREELATLMANTGAAWSRLNNEISRLSAEPRTPEPVIRRAKDQLDEARARLSALKYQAQGGIDVQEPLRQAEQLLAEAQKVWDEIENGVDGQLAQAEDQLDQLYEQATRLIGSDVRRNQVVDALAAQYEELQTQPHPAKELVNALQEAGVIASTADAVEKANRLLAERKSLADRRADNQRVMAAAMVDLRDVNRRIEELRSEAAQPMPFVTENSDGQGEYERTSAELRAAEARRDNLRAARRQADEWDPTTEVRLRSLLSTAHATAAVAQQQYEIAVAGGQPRQASDSAPPAPRPDEQLASIPVRPWWEGDGGVSHNIQGTTYDDIEMYLVARAASLRRILHGESLPLLLDSVLEGVDPDVTSRTLDSLAKVGAIVQIIYLAGNDAAEKWAKRQDISTAAVVRLERAHSN
jgi:hypothetical protein